MEFGLVFLAGLAVSFFSSMMSGGLAVLSLSSLLAFGLPPYVAFGTFRLGAFGFVIGGLLQYYRAKKIAWEYVVPLTVIGLIGTVIGVELVLAIDEAILEKIIGWVILLFIPFTILKPDLGMVRRIISVREKITGYVIYFLASIWGASISIGTGFFMLYTKMHFLGLTLLESKGTSRVPNFFKVILAIILFASEGLVDWQVGGVFAAGMFVGSTVGTRYAIKLGDSWLRYILLATIGLFALKLILGY